MSINERVPEVDSNDDDAPTSKWSAVPDKVGVVLVERREGRDGEPSCRLEVRLVVSVESESNFYMGFTENLSDSGVFVATHSPKGIGCRVDLVLMLPEESPIRATGTVRWLRQYSEENETIPGMGIRFDQLSKEDVARIREFTKSRQPMFFDDESAPHEVDLPEVARA